jgi:hypothetical protein
VRRVLEGREIQSRRQAVFQSGIGITAPDGIRRGRDMHTPILQRITVGRLTGPRDAGSLVIREFRHTVTLRDDAALSSEGDDGRSTRTEQPLLDASTNAAA